MINRATMWLYNISPVFLQNGLCTLAGRRYLKVRHGGDFDRWADFYQDARAWSAEQLLAYQEEQLAKLIERCFATVPFYAKRWREAGLQLRDFKNLDDLAKFPCTTKEDLFQAGERIISTDTARRVLIPSMTGGSTGMPLRVYWTPAELQRHYAVFWDRMRQGVRRGDRYATFQGKEVVPDGQRRPPYWRDNRAANQRLYSMRYLSPKTLEAYAADLASESFVYYQGYPSIMTVIAEFMQDKGIFPHQPPQAVFTTSEQLEPATRKLFETTWRTKVWDEYCQGEHCALIRQCTAGNYHAQMDYGIVEYEPIGEEDGHMLAEIICTGFIPQAAPMIRYRVGDRALVQKEGACSCGYPGPVIKGLRGRVSDCILTPDGRKYPHVSLIVDLLRNVRGTQVVQERVGEITVRIVPFPEFSAADEKHVKRCFEERIGGGLQVRVQRVAELERRPNGKVLSIINRIKQENHQPDPRTPKR